MTHLLKFEMKCSNRDCDRTSVILVDPEESEAPNLCPFCGTESYETTQDES